MIKFDLGISRDLDTSCYFLIFTPWAQKRQATCFDVNGHTSKFDTDLGQIIKKEKHRRTIYSKQVGWVNFASVGHFPIFSLDLLYSLWKTNTDHFSENIWTKFLY